MATGYVVSAVNKKSKYKMYMHVQSRYIDVDSIHCSIELFENYIKKKKINDSISISVSWSATPSIFPTKVILRYLWRYYYGDPALDLIKRDRYHISMESLFLGRPVEYLY